MDGESKPAKVYQFAWQNQDDEEGELLDVYGVMCSKWTIILHKEIESQFHIVITT